MNLLEPVQKLKPKRLAFDIESNHADIHLPDWELWGLSVYTVVGGKPMNCYVSTSDPEAIPVFRKLFEWLFDEDILLLGHNVKYDLRGLMAAGVIDRYPDRMGQVVDTMVAANLLNENLTERELGLKALVKQVFGHQMATYKEASLSGRESTQFQSYAMADTEWTYRLWADVFAKEIETDDLWKLLTNVVMQKVIYLCEMEDRGLRWSFPRSRDLLVRYAELRGAAEDVVHAKIGADVSLSSPDAVAKRVFEDMHMDSTGVLLTPSGDRHSLDKNVLDMLAKREPVFERLRDFRSASKMINTYIEPNVKRAIASKDGRVHPTFWVVSRTGRDRCQNPNFQNQPVISDESLNIRSCVIPADGFDMIIGDLSQIELRGCAHVSGDEEMTRAYTTWQCTKCGNKGVAVRYLDQCPLCGALENEDVLKGKSGFWHGLDIHQMTADATSLPRSPGGGNNAAAKNVNFAAIYLATPWKMMQQFGTFDTDGWAEILDKFFTKYVGVKQWHVRMKALMVDKGIVRSVFGRYRRVPKEEIRRAFKHALNMFVNFPIQSLAADYLALAERNIRRDLMEAGVWLTDVFPINAVHDEIAFECRKEMTEYVTPVILSNMRYAVQLRVPVNADLKVVDSWGDAK